MSVKSPKLTLNFRSQFLDMAEVNGRLAVSANLLHCGHTKVTESVALVVTLTEEAAAFSLH